MPTRHGRIRAAREAKERGDKPAPAGGSGPATTPPSTGDRVGTAPGSAVPALERERAYMIECAARLREHASGLENLARVFASFEDEHWIAARDLHVNEITRQLDTIIVVFYVPSATGWGSPT